MLRLSGLDCVDAQFENLSYRSFATVDNCNHCHKCLSDGVNATPALHAMELLAEMVSVSVHAPVSLDQFVGAVWGRFGVPSLNKEVGSYEIVH